ncbi:glycine betaine ABC transporter substrate-binding protein [Lichenicoccus sp.]|uniref:glycine betaine ABC transporter substrate-binding protein n=1 Tax=Lichenicoccus sp. TaxID=2781899 RepID=UPI003D120845
MDTIRLGYPDILLHEASAAAVARVLEAHDLEVEYVPAALAALPALLDADAFDLLATAWLPATDAALLASGRMQPLGLLYRPRFVWCVIGAAPAAIGDLAASSALDRRIVVDAASPLACLSEAALTAYGLQAAGYVVERVDGAMALAWAEAGDASRIVPLSQPHGLLHAMRLRPLADPKLALGGEQEARLLLRRALRPTLDGDLIDELDELTLGNKVVSALAHAMRTGGMSAQAAAEAWQRGRLSPRA